jgi:uncharacterized protein (TIGR03437 family)
MKPFDVSEVRLDRRRFLQMGAASVAALHSFSRTASASPYVHRGRVPSMITNALASPAVGFPTVTPNFAAAFVPGTGKQKLVSSETFDAFSAQADILAAANYRLACFTTIQSMNRTWFYGVFQPGTGDYYFLRTTDQNAFQQAFTQRQGSYNLVDFDISWQLGAIYYSGYWLAATPAKSQLLLLNQTFQDLDNARNRLSGSNQRMTRVQAFPQQDAATYNALLEPGSDSSALYSEPIANFATDIDAKFSANTLIGIAFDPISGNLTGCFRGKAASSLFVHNQDWPTLTATVQQAAAKGLMLQGLCSYPNAPSFDDYFATNLAPFTMGYAYAVAKDGVIIGSGGGYARSPFEADNPAVPFTPDTRLNLASSSKSITAVTLEALLQLYPNITLDSPFWPLIQAKVPNPHPSVKVVTLRNLATMKSGMVQEPGEGPIFPPNNDFWGYLNTYLAQALVATPGVTYYYDNTNFSILQGVIEQVSGIGYVDFATKYVLAPASIDPSIMNATPDPRNKAALTYSGPYDSRDGYYWPPIGFVGPGGWISSARELVKIPAALRGTRILPEAVITEMFSGGIGWYSITGNFGTYYHHNGSIGNGRNPSQSLNTCVMHLSEGYDIAVVSDSYAPQDVVPLCVGAFDSRGLPAADLPANAPSITSAVNSAGFLPIAAPGGYVSIIGTGFTDKSLTWDASVPGANLPIELSGIRVRVNSEFAYVEYISPTQINFLLPAATRPGIANVEVTTPAGGLTTSLQIDSVAPGLFSYQLKGTLFPAALFAGTDTYVAAKDAVAGYKSRPAVAGDVIELFGTGMGLTNPAAPDGVFFSDSYPAAKLADFKATIGGIDAPVVYAGMVSPGLFQVNVQIPKGLTGGDQTIDVAVGGTRTQPNLKITVQA